MDPFKMLIEEMEVLKSSHPHPNFSNFFQYILHTYKTATGSNTSTDAAGLVHVRHLVDLGL